MIQPQLKVKPHVTICVVAMLSNIDSNKELMNENRVRLGLNLMEFSNIIHLDVAYLKDDQFLNFSLTYHTWKYSTTTA